MDRSEITRAQRVRGALLGVHVGDALGCTVEFCSHGHIQVTHPNGLREIVGGGPFGWAPGHATDDTDLTRAVLLAYLNPGDDVVRAAADLMLKWARGEDWPDRQPGSRPPDIGRATEAGLTVYMNSHDPRQAGAGAGQAGNGSLMRAIPTAVCRSDRAQRIRESMEISAITHDDPWCTVSCAAYNEMAAALLAGQSAAAALEAGREAAGELGEPEVLTAIDVGARLNLARAADQGPRELRGNASGLVLDSLSLAVAAMMDPRDFENVLVDVVRVGRDTDSNAAIAGGLLGARDGCDAIPQRWVDTLQFREEFTALADQLIVA